MEQTDHPFKQKKRVSAKKLYRILLFLTFLALGYAGTGIYFSFFDTAPSSFLFSIKDKTTKENVLTPPPMEETPAQKEIADISAQIEQQQQNIDNLKKQIDEIDVEGTEKSEIEKLHDEQVSEENKKIEAIEQLNKEREAELQEKTDASTSGTAPVSETPKAVENVDSNVPTTGNDSPTPETTDANKKDSTSTEQQTKNEEKTQKKVAQIGGIISAEDAHAALNEKIKEIENKKTTTVEMPKEMHVKKPIHKMQEMPSFKSTMTQLSEVGKEKKTEEEIKQEEDKRRLIFRSYEELPLPEVLHDDIKASLPDFSSILKGTNDGREPLHLLAPLENLQEDHHYGKVPRVDPEEGMTAFKAYSAPAKKDPKTNEIYKAPFLSVMISNLGLKDNLAQSAINVFPPEVSLSFTVYSRKLDEYFKAARTAGHETLIDMPVQVNIFPQSDPGPLGLVAGLPEQENRKRFYKVLGLNLAYIGLATPADQTFSFLDTEITRDFVDETTRRGLIFVSGTDNANENASEKTISPDIYIRNNFYRSALRNYLNRVKKKVLKDGKAFLRIDACPVCLVELMAFIKQAEPTDANPIPEFVLQPVSYYVEQTRK